MHKWECWNFVENEIMWRFRIFWSYDSDISKSYRPCSQLFFKASSSFFIWLHLLFFALTLSLLLSPIISLYFCFILLFVFHYFISVFLLRRRFVPLTLTLTCGILLLPLWFRFSIFFVVHTSECEFWLLMLLIFCCYCCCRLYWLSEVTVLLLIFY